MNHNQNIKDRQTSWLDLHCCADPALYVGKTSINNIVK